MFSRSSSKWDGAIVPREGGTPNRLARARWFAACLVAALLVGCSASTSPGAEGPSGSASAIIDPGPADVCSPIDLRTPSGSRLDLTGTWTGDDARFFVAQFGDCVFWEELSAEENRPLGERFRRLFAGQLRADFTIAGRFGITYLDPNWLQPAPGYVVPRWGEAVYRVVIHQDGGSDVVTLEGPARESNDFRSFRTVVLTRISTSTDLPR